MRNRNFTLIIKELKENNVVGLFDSTLLDAQMRKIYYAFDGDLRLENELLPYTWQDITFVESKAIQNIIKKVINGVAVIEYLVILGDEKVPFTLTVNHQTKPRHYER